MANDYNIPEPKNDKQYGLFGIIMLVITGIGAIVKLLSGGRDNGSNPEA